MQTNNQQANAQAAANAANPTAPPGMTTRSRGRQRTTTPAVATAANPNPPAQNPPVRRSARRNANPARDANPAGSNTNPPRRRRSTGTTTRRSRRTNPPPVVEPPTAEGAIEAPARADSPPPAVEPTLAERAIEARARANRAAEAAALALRLAERAEAEANIPANPAEQAPAPDPTDVADAPNPDARAPAQPDNPQPNEVADEPQIVDVNAADFRIPRNVQQTNANAIEQMFECLTNVMGFTNAHASILMDDGYSRAKDFVHWKYDEIEKWAVTKAKLAAHRGNVQFSQLHIKKLQAFAWWVTDRKLRNLDSSLDLFDDEELDTSINEAKMEYYEIIGRKSITLTKPDKFKTNTWIHWEQSIYNYLGSLYNPWNVPLSYVIYIKGTDQYGVTRDREKEKVYCAPTEGTAFDRDTQQVLKILQELTLGTDAEDWIRDIDCGRRAMAALQDHFDGAAEGERRKQQAKAELATLFYRNESSYTFEKYATKLKNSFDILARYKVPYYEEDKVKLLLDRIQTSSGELKTAISICRENHGDTFTKAVTFMQTNISRIFPSHGKTTRSRRQIHASGGNNRDGGKFGGNNKGGRGRSRGSRGGRGNNRGSDKKRSFDHYGPPNSNVAKSNREFDNGVDVTDKTRRYTDDEWWSLSREMQDKIKAAKSEKRRKTYATSSQPMDHLQISQLITDTAKAVASEFNDSKPGSITASRAVSSSTTSSKSGYRNSSNTSEITYDAYGNPNN